MKANRLASALRDLGEVRVHWTHWDDFIEGRAQALTNLVLPAREVAARELQRWRAGRFSALQVAIADAVFSKQKIYRTAVTNHIRPFAKAWMNVPFEAFCGEAWTKVHTQTFGKEPKDPHAPTHNHLSSEGRIRTILDAGQRLQRLGLREAKEASAWAQDVTKRIRMEEALRATTGLGEALVSNILMNLGHLRPKLDTHVRAVVSETTGITFDAAPHEMLQRIEEAGMELGMHPFEIDQVIWYARAERA